ncbi:DUF3363 domain-containing protein [Sphingomonas donggukensis]|uniref:DUF3363 domain-containing protein n=1 Tax=Sphingomonas donggukensis TaxID=2949093 RepID=A0ABY4TYL4_9SPHN|nr:DUF3363 domain-containing protein [Sphingomonas donggukensis]URW77094.1 DUF3363 domain-containing protein [Sphingomonas donggukensis]
MSDDRRFQVRPGRIRSAKAKGAKTFLATALKSAQKAGGLEAGGRSARSTFGRGRASSVAAHRLLGDRSRGAIVKARVVRMRGSVGALRAHVAYLQRDGVTRDGEPGRLFGATDEVVDGRAFAERCAEDRHHFRFIVSPDDAAELDSLKDFTRTLLDDAARDLGTRLDWVAVDHWNTAHPHVHILVRGRDEDGENLVIGRDYISRGLRARAGALVTQELGPKSELEIRRALDAEVGAERWTRLDRLLGREAARADGIIDLRPGGSPDPLRFHRIGRMHTLERLGLAASVGAGRWALAAEAEARLRDLSIRGDVIRRMHRAMGEGSAPADWVLDASAAGQPVIGRLAAHGLDNELAGTAFAIIDGADGRVHHVALPSVAALGEPVDGAIVELRQFADARSAQRTALAVRSDWTLDQQVTAEGATWLDRQLVARTPVALADRGFGAEVNTALAERADQLSKLGLARRNGSSWSFAPGMLDDLRRRDLAREGRRLAGQTGLAFETVEAGDAVSGVFRRRLNLASGRFAMIDNGLGFQLVPWSPGLERHRGGQVDGIAGPGGIDWSRSRDRGISI